MRLEMPPDWEQHARACSSLHGACAMRAESLGLRTIATWPPPAEYCTRGSLLTVLRRASRDRIQAAELTWKLRLRMVRGRAAARWLAGAWPLVISDEAHDSRADTCVPQQAAAACLPARMRGRCNQAAAACLHSPCRRWMPAWPCCTCTPAHPASSTGTSSPPTWCAPPRRRMPCGRRRSRCCSSR